MARKSGLGRGIGALIPQHNPEATERAVDDTIHDLLNPPARSGGRKRGRGRVSITETGLAGGDVSRETSVSETGAGSGSNAGSAAGAVRGGAGSEGVSSGAGSAGAGVNGGGAAEGGAVANGSAAGGVDLVPVPGASFAELDVKDIVPNTKQPRTVFDEDDLLELRDSIMEVGLLQPIVVRPLRAKQVEENDGAHYELIMGERRWRATQLAGKTVVPAIIRQTADEDLLRDALLENLHRANLNPLEEAAAYQQLLEEFGCTQEVLAKRIARSRPQISNTLRLLKLPPSVQTKVAAGVISAGHARALLSLEDPGAMEKLAERIIAEGISVRSTEEIISLGEAEGRKAGRSPRARRQVDPQAQEFENQIEDLLDTRVKVQMGRKKGKVVIEFAGPEDLARIIQVMKH